MRVALQGPKSRARATKLNLQFKVHKEPGLPRNLPRMQVQKWMRLPRNLRIVQLCQQECFQRQHQDTNAAAAPDC